MRRTKDSLMTKLKYIMTSLSMGIHSLIEMKKAMKEIETEGICVNTFKKN